jgi:hypothetical protein
MRHGCRLTLRLFPYLNSRRLGLLTDINFGTEAQESFEQLQ